MLVNPHHRMIEGMTVYPNVASLPHTPDLALIVTPAAAVPALIGELAERGTRAAVIIAAGFGEMGPLGQTLQQAALDAAKPHLLRIVGPNCVGIMVRALGSMPRSLIWQHRREISPSSANRVRCRRSSGGSVEAGGIAT